MKLQQVKGFRSLAVLTLLTSLIVADVACPVARATTASSVPPPSGIVSWWKAEGNALDSIGLNNGQLGTNVAYVPGYVGEGFSFTGADGSGVTVGNPTNLQLQDFTIETWMKRNNTNLVTYHSFGYADFFAYGEAGYGFAINNDGNLCFTKITTDVTWVNTGIKDTNFHHVAVTKSGTQLIFYVDGVAYTNAAPYYSTFAFYTSASIGMRADDQTASFLGVIDELAIYNRPLASSEIQSVYNAGRDGKNASPIVPTITQNPASLTVGVGINATFSVVAAGYPAPSYQWQFNSVSIQDATNATFVIPSATPGSAGVYSVVVSNAVGSVVSSNAVLTVIDYISVPAGIVSWWKAEGNVIDSIGSNNGQLSTNVAYVPGYVGEGFSFDGTDGSGVIVGNPTNLQLQDFTIETWMKRNNTNLVTYHSFGYADFFAYGEAGYGFAINNDGNLCFTKITTDVTWVNTGIKDTNFHHVAVTKSGTQLIFYVDGVAYTNAAPYYSTFAFYTSASIGMRADDQTASFLGVIDELAIYNRPLASSEIYSIYNAGRGGKATSPIVPTIIQNPVSLTVGVGTNATFSVVATGYPAPSYQWQFNSVSIQDATNATFVIPSATPGSAGVYSVVASNAVGSVTSSNVVLAVIAPISITGQPQDQAVLAGSNATFLVQISTTASFQWYFNDVVIPGATNASLELTNVNTKQAGLYHVVAFNGYSYATSSNAALTVNTPPVIYGQPQDQNIVDGSTAVFSVNGIGDPKTITSNSLALWLKADAGVEKDSLGQVSAWRDQSGNHFDAAQSVRALQPVLSSSSALSGQPVVHFNGVQSPSEGQYLFCSSNLNTGNGFTAFLVYQHGNRDKSVLEETPVLVGVPGIRYHCQSFYIWTNSMMGLSSWGNDFFSGFNIPTDKFRVWTERLNANRTTLEFFDTDGSSNFSASVSTSWMAAPGAGYYIGGEGSYTRNFYGDIAELIYFRGKLSDSDKTLVDNYLKLKYFHVSSATDVSYQWYFNGGIIPGATNSVLTLTNAGVAQVGSYSVVLSNQWGTLTSSNAVLALNYPPTFITQLQDQAVNVGGNVTLSSPATGSDPISYQWLYNGTIIVGATNSSLQLTNVAVAVAGSYQIVAANAFGSVTNTANVVVNASTIVIGSGDGVGATQISVPVQLISIGTENAIGFSIAFDSKLLSLVSADPGANIGGATIFFNTNNASSGNVGVVLGMSAGTTFSAGTQEIARITFQVAPLVTNTVTALSVANQPTVCRVADVNAKTIEAVYIGGTYTISHIEVEGDVFPLPDGDLAVLVDDWVQVGRFVAGLDTITNSSEFQRADCAPRETLGDGRLTITDWVQTGRYAAGLDPVTPAGGPTEPSTNSGNLRATRKLTGSTREVTLIPVTAQNSVNAALVELTASGDENAIGFSLNFDTSILRYSKTVLNVTSQGAVLNVNTNKVASGQLGFGLALPVGKTFTAGLQQLVRIEFLPVSYASNSTMIAFSDIPVWRELSDVNANSLATNFSSQAIQVMGLPLPTLSVSTQSTNITLSWPSSTSGFVLEGTPAFGKGWNAVTADQVTNNGSISVTVPLSQQQQYYRLKKP